MVNDSDRARSPRKSTLTVSLLAVLVGGGAALAIIHQTAPVFPMADLAEPSLNPSPEEVQIHLQAAIDFYSWNYAVDFMIVGGCLGFFTGVFTTRRRQARSALGAAIAGITAGGLAGYIAGHYIAIALAASANQSLIQSSLYHYTVWAAITVAVLVTIATIQGQFNQVYTHALTGLLSALFAVVVYGMLAAIFFPRANLLLLVPESLTERIAWMFTCVLLVGFGTQLGLRKSAEPGPVGAEPVGAK